mgnify:CR=1 FL=1
MSEQSAKPYLVRAICEWCADNGLTPYLDGQGERRDARARGVRQERRDRAQRQRVGDAPPHDRQSAASASPRAFPARRRKSPCRCRRSPASSPRRPGYGFAFTDRAGSAQPRSRPATAPSRIPMAARSERRPAGQPGSRRIRGKARSRGRRTCRSSSSRGATGAARFRPRASGLARVVVYCAPRSARRAARRSTFAASCGVTTDQRRRVPVHAPGSRGSVSATASSRHAVAPRHCARRRSARLFCVRNVRATVTPRSNFACGGLRE